MINIHIDNIYAYHLGFICHLLKIDYNIITSISTFDFADYLKYYNNMLTILNKQTNTYLEVAFFDYFLKNKLFIYPTIQTSGTDIYILANKSMKECESDLFEFLDLSGYDTDRIKNQHIIAWTIQNMYNRIPSNEEILFNYEQNGYNSNNYNSDDEDSVEDVMDIDKINLFSWLMILYFNKEGRDLNYHLPYFTIIREIRSILKIPVSAVIFSSFSENYIDFYNSHKIIIENPYIDIFIHTWEQKGPRYKYHTDKANIINLIHLYKPKNILVENLINTINSNSTLIFLKNNQEHDDATRYINRRLYSLNKAYSLITTYENINNFKYSNIIKLDFIYDISLDYKKICNNLNKNALYSKNGCERCNFEVKWPQNYTNKRHDDHFNDISEYWFYGSRLISGLACQLYNNINTLNQLYYTSNCNIYPLIPHKQYREFIYILKSNYLSNQIQCYYTPTLLKNHMKLYWCLSDNKIIYNNIINGQICKKDFKN
jgi:hypothetical protein